MSFSLAGSDTEANRSDADEDFEVSPRCGKKVRDVGKAGEGLGHASACGAQQGRGRRQLRSAHFRRRFPPVLGLEAS